jgi:hypothetical protein
MRIGISVHFYHIKKFETTATPRYNMIQYNYDILTDIVSVNSCSMEAILWM